MFNKLQLFDFKTTIYNIEGNMVFRKININFGYTTAT